MWIQHNHPNTIVLCVHVGIIATLDQRIVVVILGIPNQKKQMCLTKLSMKHLYKYPNVIEFVWYHQEHTCEDGTPGHGTLDCDSQSCKF
jgi:hypothetical protein